MLHQQGLTRDKVLFRILKNKSPTATIICEKLKQNVKNIVVLTEDELCELWHHTKGILLEAQKLYSQTSRNKSKYEKEWSVMIKLIRTITAMALETISQRMFIPNVLLQNIILLHSVVLPNIKDEQAKNEISCLLENWWKLDMTWKEKVITNVLKYLIQGCKSSLQHVKRLYEIRSTLTLLKCTEDVQELLKLVREKTVMSLEEGRLMILHLFTLGEQYILGIHNNVKVVLQNVGQNYLAGYADLYLTAWSNAKGKLKNFIIDNCLQDIIFHCFRAYRNSTGRGKLGKNLLSFLTAAHDNKNQAARSMIHDRCKILLWKHLKAPGSYIRCNAVEILFVTSSFYYTCAPKDRNRSHLRRYYKTVTDLLKDTNHEVCIVTMNGVFKTLEKHWNSVPNNIIRDWLNIFLQHTKNCSHSDVRANIFVGLKKILSKERSHRILKEFLPNLANSIYDEDKQVLEALIKLLWHAHNQIGIAFWDIVPLTYILDRLETTQDTLLLEELVKLVWLRVSINDPENPEKMTEEMVYVGMNNVNAIRRFCFHSKFAMNWETSSKLIENTLTLIKEEIDCLPIYETKKQSVKKSRTNNNRTETINDWEEEDSDHYRDLQIYIDVIAMLLLANLRNLNLNSKETGTNILQDLANMLPELSKCCKETAVNNSVTFLLSLIPPNLFVNKIEVIETLVQQLCDPNTSDDAVLTVIYVLMKWEKGNTILFALSNLFKQSLCINVENNQESCNSAGPLKMSDKGLELSLRILKHLLHVKHQSVLMNKYHQDVLKFWETLHVLRTFIIKILRKEFRLDSQTSKDLVVQFFKEYTSMTFSLHKVDVFDASERFSEILLWVKKVIVPHIPEVYVAGGSNISVDIIKNTMDLSRQLLIDYNATPKLCCDIVLLYSSCLSAAGGVVFFNNAFDAIVKLLDFSKIAFDNDEPNLLNVIVPNFVCVTMVSLTRYNQDSLTKHANNLKALQDLTQKYFSVVKSTINDQKMCLPYITIMFNTAISSISTEMTRILQNSSVTEDNILITQFPYLAKKILSIIFNTKRYQKMSVQVVSKTITSYAKIDMLSALVIIHKMIQSSDKTITNTLKNVTLATKIQNHTQTCDTPFDRTMNDAMDIVIHAILQR